MITDGNYHKQFSCGQMLPDPADVADREMSRILEYLGHSRRGAYCDFFVTETLPPGSKENDNPGFDGPKGKEMCGILDKNTFQVV